MALVEAPTTLSPHLRRITDSCRIFAVTARCFPFTNDCDSLQFWDRWRGRFTSPSVPSIGVRIPIRIVVGIHVPIERRPGVGVGGHRVHAQKAPDDRVVSPLLHVHEPGVDVVYVPSEPQLAYCLRIGSS
jgi:hypothetical protein